VSVIIKVLGLSASPRRGATEHSLAVALEELDKFNRIEYQMITLRKFNTYQCIHCDRCIREEEKYCLVNEDSELAELYEKFYQADGYLLASPVYQMNYTGQLACFFNLLRPAWNILKDDRAYFWDKVGAAIAVGGTRHGGQELTINAIHNFYHNYGITVVGGNFAYNGGTIWSRDNKKKGAAADTEGLKTIKAIADRLALALYSQQGGKEFFKEAYQKISSQVKELA